MQAWLKLLPLTLFEEILIISFFSIPGTLAGFLFVKAAPNPTHSPEGFPFLACFHLLLFLYIASFGSTLSRSRPLWTFWLKVALLGGIYWAILWNLIPLDVATPKETLQRPASVSERGMALYATEVELLLSFRGIIVTCAALTQSFVFFLRWLSNRAGSYDDELYDEDDDYN